MSGIETNQSAITEEVDGGQGKKNEDIVGGEGEILDSEGLIDEEKLQEEVKAQIRNFGMVIVGPSGSGKSTLTDGIQQFMNGINRKCCVVNLDPANENIKYEVSSLLFEVLEESTSHHLVDFELTELTNSI